jgi:hypothetical protein
MRILKVVGTETRPCKCSVGIYETYSGEIVRVVDLVPANASCVHRLGQEVEALDGSSAHVPSGPAKARRSS